MNALSLRVSSVKTSDNVRKNAEMRIAPVKLPMAYRQCQEWYSVQLRDAHTVPEQVACVKRIYQTAMNDIEVQQFLCDLLFNSPLKHPVRRQIVKVLQSSRQTVNESLETASTVGSASIHACIEKSLRNLITDLLSNVNSSGNWNIAIASISGCFDNFDAALKSLGRCIDTVFPVLCKSVENYLADLPNLSSPSGRNEYYLYIHNSIRVLLNCVQEFGESLKRTQLQLMQQLNIQCQQIILDRDIPMDPRTNAGILVAYLAKLNNDYSNFIAYMQDIQNPQEIALCVGVINTCRLEDFQLYASELRQICNKIHEIAKANATVPNLLLCVSRALFQISKQLLNVSPSSIECKTEIKAILEKLIEFSVAFMDHHMDSVRHISRDIMRNVVAVGKKSFDIILPRIFDICNSEQLSIAVKCVILHQATYALGAEEILKHCKILFTHLFADNLGRDFVVNNLYEALMLSNYKEQLYEKWSSVWISYLLKIAACQDSRLSNIETLIVKAVKCDVRVVHTIILSGDENSQQEIPISTKLSTLWAVRKSGVHIDNFSGLMKEFSKHFQLSLLSNDDDTRIMALRLIVDTNKTTEPLSALECDHLLIYLQFNSNCQSPATRQKSLSMLSKALSKCHIGLMKQTKGKGAKAVIDVTLSTRKVLELRFLQDFMNILIKNLFEGANFSRRSLSLQLLKQCLSIAVECNLDLMSLLPSTTLKALLTTLADSYESNKELAVNMLKILLRNQGDKSLVDTNDFNINLECIQSMLTSVKPTESVTAAYQLEFFCYSGNVDVFGSFNVPNQSSRIYAALKWLLEQLKEGLKLAELSILEAAKYNPLYGLLFAVNHLLKNVDYALISEEDIWRKLIEEYITLCKNLTNVVAPIVNSSSPEGHLPNDFSELPEELHGASKITSQDTKTLGLCKILSSQQSKVDMALVKTTPQMVLICAWRTVKEVSLMLGDIVLNAAIKMSPECLRYLITKLQILEIGEHFKLLLSETKHRGAFEQAYVGFSKLCCRLWCVESEDLNALPMQWLHDLITVISQEDHKNGKICATRRSAGVPFMVQALITSELKVGTTKALMFCMQRLLQLCLTKDTSSESRTHALNILRALFRCTDLSEAVGEYVSEGVMAAILGYDAINWSEKNSSTLLFAALITRIFGVQLTKDSDNLNIRNRMTGRVFFLRYPKLYDFFLDELKAASLLIENRQKANKLHPLLLILSRLYSSALEGTESNLKLSAFIPYILKCGGCPEMQTRILAAKAMVALMNKDEMISLLLCKSADVMISSGSSKLQHNILHGNLLQIFYLVKRNNSVLNEKHMADIIKYLFGMHKQTELTNAVLLKVELDILIEMICSPLSSKLKSSSLQQLTYFTGLHCSSDPNMILYYPVLRKSSFLYNLFIMHLIMPTVAALADYISDFNIEDISIEQLETCLNIILYILALDKHKTATCHIHCKAEDINLNNLLEEFEIMPSEIQFVHALSDTVVQELAMELKNSNVLYKSLINILEMPKFYPVIARKSYAIISFMKQFDLSLSFLLKVSRIHSDDVKAAITMCAERIFELQGVNYDTAESCLEYLMEIAHPSQPYCLRLKAASCTSYLNVHYPKSLEMRCMTFLRLYIKLMLTLFMDDDYDIRDLATKLVLSNLQNDMVLHFCDQPDIIISLTVKGIVPTVVQRVFLQYTAELLDALTNEEDKDSFILDVFKIITGDNKANTQNFALIDEMEIFDKSEANVYAEPLTAAIDAVEIFKWQFQNRTPVVEYISDFINNLKKNEKVY